MATDSPRAQDQPPPRRAAAIRRPATVVVTAGRTSGAGQPLNVPLVLASTFRAAATVTGTAAEPPGREYARDDGTPTWEALEQVVGQLEGR